MKRREEGGERREEERERGGRKKGREKARGRRRGKKEKIGKESNFQKKSKNHKIYFKF